MGGETLTIVGGLLLTAVLIALNALYVFHEFAFVVIKPAQARRLEEAGARLGRLIAKAVRRLDHYIAVDQLGITATSIAVGWVGQPILADLLGRPFGGAGAAAVAAGAVAFAGLTAAQMIAGELIPKTVALRHPERVARLVARPVEWTSWLLHPLVVVLNGAGTLAVRALGFAPQEARHADVLPAEELAAVIEASHRAGALTADPATLRRALSFSDLRASDVLTPRRDLLAIEADWPVERVFDVARRSRHTRFPVYDGTLDDVVGVLNVKELVRLGKDGGTEVVSDWRSVVRPIPTVPETASVEQVLLRLRQERQQMALAVDEYGGTAGVVTVADVTSQLVGDPEEIRPAGDGAYVVLGRTGIAAVEAALGITFGDDEPEQDSIGGLVMARLQRIPAVGDRVAVAGHELTVRAMDDTRVTRVELRPEAR